MRKTALMFKNEFFKHRPVRSTIFFRPVLASQPRACKIACHCSVSALDKCSPCCTFSDRLTGKCARKNSFTSCRKLSSAAVKFRSMSFAFNKFQTGLPHPCHLRCTWSQRRISHHDGVLRSIHDLQGVHLSYQTDGR